MNLPLVSLVTGFAACLAGTVAAQEPPTLLTTPLAEAFGSAPLVWDVELSPDGGKVSFLQTHPEGHTMVRVLDVAEGSVVALLAGKSGEYDIAWCDWKSDARLLCGLERIEREGVYYTLTRLAAINVDGTDMRILRQRRLDDRITQHQDRVIDWLPEDPEHVLVQMPSPDGSGVGRLNVYTGDLKSLEGNRPEAYDWITDGHGVPRLYNRIDALTSSWFVRRTPEPDADWTLLKETPLDDLEDGFSPIGFGERRDELLFFDTHEGRAALHALDLTSDERRVVFAHPALDLDSVRSLGKYSRLAMAIYIEDRPRFEFFDARAAEIHAAVAGLFPGKIASVIDEDWSGRYYLVFVGSDRDPGTYHRYDAGANVLEELAPAYAKLAGRELAPMQAIHYAAADGTAIPAYLTLPPGVPEPLPAVILPHGGPASRDYWSYDYLVQFLVANGYAVLQSNYRGSTGYGIDWRGQGGFRDWRKAIADIRAGAQYLVDSGIADPQRICAVGWSFGGYAALMSVIEDPNAYRCVISIAGVTDPDGLGHTMRSFIGGLGAQAFIGTEPEVRRAGSPLVRADEITVPTLLIHAQKDMNVPVAQSSDLYRALGRDDKDVELIEYREAEHSIVPERYRIDLLARVATFLDEHIGKARQ